MRLATTIRSRLALTRLLPGSHWGAGPSLRCSSLFKTILSLMGRQNRFSRQG